MMQLCVPGVFIDAATEATLVAFTKILGYELEKFGVKTILVFQYNKCHVKL